MTLLEELTALAAGHSGVAGIAAENLSTGDRVAVRADDPFPAASSIKVFVLLSLLQQAARGQMDLSQRAELDHGARTLGSGVLLHLDAGLRPTLWDLAVLMMMVSDNTATNLLLDRLGVDAVNESIRSAGLENTRLGGKIDFGRLSQDPSALGVSPPGALCAFYARLARAELLAREQTERMLALLRIQKYIEPLRRDLPADPYAREFGDPEPVWVASKTGSLSGVRCEAGLIHTPVARWSIAVMTKQGTDRRVTSDNEGWRLVSRASRMVFDAWSAS